MPEGSDGGTTSCGAPSILDCQKGSSSEFVLNSVLARPACIVAVRQKTSFFCAWIILTRVGVSFDRLSVLASVMFLFPT